MTDQDKMESILDSNPNFELTSTKSKRELESDEDEVKETSDAKRARTAKAAKECKECINNGNVFCRDTKTNKPSNTLCCDDSNKDDPQCQLHAADQTCSKILETLLKSYPQEYQDNYS